ALDDRFARFDVAGDDIDHALGETGFVAKLGELEGAHRRFRGAFENERVAGGERGPQLPYRHREWKIPRDDLPADADRLAHRHQERAPRLLHAFHRLGLEVVTRRHVAKIFELA